MIENTPNTVSPSTTTTAPNASNQAAQTAANMRSRINDSIDHATTRLGDVVEERAHAMSNKTQELLTNVAHTGQYLRESEPRKLGADLVALVRRHPVIALSVGAGFGMLVSRAFRR